MYPQSSTLLDPIELLELGPMKRKWERGSSHACNYLHNNTREKTQEMEYKLSSSYLQMPHNSTWKRAIPNISSSRVHGPWCEPKPYIHGNLTMSQLPHTRVAVIQLLFCGNVASTTNHAHDINDNHPAITCEVELDIATLPLKLKSNSNTPSKPLNLWSCFVTNEGSNRRYWSCGQCHKINISY